MKKTAVLKNGIFWHFGIRPGLASLYGCKETDIIEVNLEIAEDQTRPENEFCGNGDYWGWYDDKKQEFTMTYDCIG